jgi:phosphate starvation-inducible PhoH-like protein
MPNTNKAARKAARKSKRKLAQEKTINERSSNQPLSIEWRTAGQKTAWHLMEKNAITFLLGSAGSGKTFLAMAYAINEVLQQRRSQIILTRPIVDAGEKLGFLPGTFGEKVNPYMQPLYDTMDLLLGKFGKTREQINKAIVLAPLCYMRGRTFNDAVCIFDEAQNATYAQLKLFLSRFGQNTQVFVTGDPKQSDLPGPDVALLEVVEKLKGVANIGTHRFSNDDVVRHPLVAAILKKL